MTGITRRSAVCRSGVSQARRLLVAAFAFGFAVMPAQAVTRQGSFQVRAFVVASCGISGFGASLDGNLAGFACQTTPSFSPILPPPPRTILQRDEGESVLTVEF